MDDILEKISIVPAPEGFAWGEWRMMRFERSLGIHWKPKPIDFKIVQWDHAIRDLICLENGLVYETNIVDRSFIEKVGLQEYILQAEKVEKYLIDRALEVRGMEISLIA